MKNPLITIDSHTAKVIACMLAQYSQMVINIDIDAGPEGDFLITEEAEQAAAIRKYLLDAVKCTT